MVAGPSKSSSLQGTTHLHSRIPPTVPADASLVSVVVVSFNGRDLLPDCLASLCRQTYRHHEVIVVDNGSSDGSAEWLHKHYPSVRVVALPSNRGFAGGTNAGIRVARGGFVATINNDVRVEPNWIEEMVRTAQRGRGVGMVASKVLFVRAPSVVDSAGLCIDRVGMAWHRLGGSYDDGSASEHEVFGPCAGAALYRRELFDDVGYFDEDFFCYLEDVDLAWRARQAGWRCVYTPRACAYHLHSATAVEDSPFKRFHLGRNKVWLIAKNFPAPEVWFYLPLILAYDLAGVMATLLMGGDGRPIRNRLAGIAGRLAGMAAMKPVLAKRQALHEVRRVAGWRVLSQMGGIPGPLSTYRRYAHLYRSGEFDNGASIK